MKIRKFCLKISVAFFGALLFAGTLFAQQNRAPAAANDNVGAVTFRCAFWERPKDEVPALFVKDGGKIKPLSVFTMLFGNAYTHRGALPITVFRKATEAEIEARKHEGLRKSELEYMPMFAINPQGKKDIGVILLPGKLENKPAKEILVFDYSDRGFPFGTVRVVNFSGRALLGKFTPRDDERGENFRLRNAGIFTSKPLGMPRRICELQLAAIVDKQPQVVYSSSSTFFEENRVMLFVVPAGGKKTAPNEAPKLEFRAIKERRPVVKEAPKAPTDAANNNEARGNASPRRNAR